MRIEPDLAATYLQTDINITETTYSCQFQYEFGNQ